MITRMSLLKTLLFLYQHIFSFALFLADLENYILKHISSYSANPCLFGGITGTIEFKRKINKFYNENRHKSMNSTIVFKAHAQERHLLIKSYLKMETFTCMLIKS